MKYWDAINLDKNFYKFFNRNSSLWEVLGTQTYFLYSTHVFKEEAEFEIKKLLEIADKE